MQKGRLPRVMPSTVACGGNRPIFIWVKDNDIIDVEDNQKYFKKQLDFLDCTSFFIFEIVNQIK